MNKKKLAIIAPILIILGWFVYRVIHAPTSKEVAVGDSDSTVTTIDSKIPSSLKTHTNAFPKEKGEVKNRVHEVPDKNFEEFDKLEKIWLEKAQEIIGADKYAMYLDMRDRNEKEKMQAYKEYHDYLRQKYGDKFSYNISEDQSVREKKINQRYLKELSKLIGEEKFRKYTEARDNYNENMRIQNKEAIQIEF
ncbi:MAG: hypothetical protein ACXVCE_16740 [Bacteriovorax sp.]